MLDILYNYGHLLFLTFALTWLVGAIPAFRSWKENHLHHFVSFSAGVLIATAFVHILPEVVENSDPHLMGFGILGGFLFLFVLEKFIMIHPCEESHCEFHQFGLSAFIGISLHSMFDGMAMGSSFLDEHLARPVFFAIIVHKMPSAFALASLLKASRWSNRRILIHLVFFSLIIPVTALVTANFLFTLPKSYGSFAMNFSLGSFLYIATSDFLPEIHRRHDQKMKNFVAFLLGVGVMVLIAGGHVH